MKQDWTSDSSIGQISSLKVFCSSVNSGKIIAICLLLAVLKSLCKAENFDIWPSHYTDHHQELHRKLRDTSHAHLEDFQVVIPSKTDQHFQHVTHDVRHGRSVRVRRNAIDGVIDDESLHYTLAGFGHNFQIYLKPNHRLLASTFEIKRIKRDTGKEELVDGEEALGCHYHGRLLSHNGAYIAMSTCNGLTGILRTEEDDFLIEPVSGHVNHSFEGSVHPHIIYSRRHLEKGKHRLHFCGKKRHYPVAIPQSPEEQMISLLSNGEIALEDLPASSSRKRRAVEYRSAAVGLNENDLADHVIKPQKRPRAKNVETLVVADRAMIENHERDHHDVTTYILTVMNMVAGLFSDRSLDGDINIVLVGLVLLEDNRGLLLDHKADRSLSNFCKWQLNLNHSENGGPDHSILLTGIDICVHKNSPCETLGLAQIGGMCSRRHSCTINEDMGLGLAFTVAHETGHSFGMKHDGQGNQCSKRDGHIMSPTLNGHNGVFTWSACSRKSLNDFLNNPSSTCLDDHPSPVNNLNFPSQLPGETYDAVTQCQWQFGADTQLCSFRYEHKKISLCKVLWCQKSNSHACETKYMPAAEGTNCGENLWCRRGVCVPYGSEGPDAIDGGWGEYGPWSTCTRTCGGGVQYRKRECNNPFPLYGGHHCQGKEKVYHICNTKKCPPMQVSFREQQCAKFNSKAYRRRYFSWIPFTKYSSFGRGRCELLCKPDGYDFFDMLDDRVIDGTSCGGPTNDVCIEGKCEKVGCDYVLGSNATLDACGVCNGDNSTCNTITGFYDDEVHDSGYYEVGRIPRGARNVRLWEEECCTHSYIAIKTASSPAVYELNGNWQIDLFGPKTIAGASWSYERKSFQVEQLYSSGPLEEEIIIEVLIISRNPGVKYSYSIPKLTNHLPGLHPVDRSPQVVFEWDVQHTECSSSCAGGIQTPVVTCLQDGGKTVDVDNCPLSSKPNISTLQCNNQSCPARWVPLKWSECSKSCGSGIQRRNVTCMSLTVDGDVTVPVAECDLSKEPESTKKCRKTPCPAQWVPGEWSKCSRECGRGRRTRPVHCRSGSQVVRKSACKRSEKPISKERCLVAYCQRKYQWFITAWEECSTTCGDGIQKRKLRCSYKKRNGQYRTVALRRCRRARKPELSLSKSCTNSPCPGTSVHDAPIIKVRSSRINLKDDMNANGYKRAMWVAGSWQKCSASCGGGIQIRLVKCLQSGQDQPALACAHRTRPLGKRSCNTYKCSYSASNEKPDGCSDNFSWCYLVPQHGQCSHSYFGTQCCKTCSNIS